MTLLSNRKFQIPPQRQKRRQQQPSQVLPNKVIDANGNGEIDDDSAKHDVDDENHDLRPHQKQRKIPAQQQQQDQR